MSNLSALKQILTTLGGTPAASDSNDETIAKTATALGTKEFLPSVTSEDKGKVPTVSNDGEWELATPGGGGGGGGVLVCTFDESNTLDHTWKEISEAPTAIAKSPITPDIYYLTGVIGVGENYAVVFSTVAEGNVIDMLFSTDSENGYPVRQHG